MEQKEKNITKNRACEPSATALFVVVVEVVREKIIRTSAHSVRDRASSHDVRTAVIHFLIPVGGSVGA